MKAGELSPTDWREHLEKWREAGGPQKDYCAAHGLTAWGFSYWKRKLGYLPNNERRAGRSGKKAPALVELRPPFAARPEQVAPLLELRIGNLFGCSVHVRIQ